MYFCGDLDMEHVYNMHRWEFMIDVRNKFSYCTIFLEQLEFKAAVLCKFTEVVTLC